MSKRIAELLLLCAATPPVLLLYALYVINTGMTLSIQTLIVPLGLALAFAVAHIAVRFLAPQTDPAFLPLVFVLSGIGITFVTRLAPQLAIKQVAWLFLSIAAMILVLILIRSLENLSKYRYTIISMGLILLISPVFIGVEHWGSKLWIEFGSFFSFQPGELAKPLIVLFLAAYLSSNRELLAYAQYQVLGMKIPPIRTLIPLLLMWVISLIIVIFERDLGSAVLFFGLFLLMIYTATGRVSYTVIGCILLVFGAFAAYKSFSHVRVRFDIWLDPFADPSDKGLQIVQSLYSLADGGLFGSGIGRGMPTKIPVVESDFIFSAVGEEMGLLGAAAIILLYMLFAIRGFLTAARARSDMAAFCAVGLTTAISLQAFIIIGGVTKLIPLTGITLPFMSQGGTSLLTSFMIVGLLLRCADSGTGIETELAGEGIQEPRLTGSHSIAILDRFSNPESGVLGRVTLGRRLTVLLSFFTFCFAVLIGNLTYIQIVKASEYQAMPGNNHTIAKASYIERGSILSSDGVTLAESVQNKDGSYSRTYPQGDLAAHVIGYNTVRFGSAGIEASQNEVLTGRSSYASWSDAIEALAGRTPPGNDVVLTINSQIQRSAQRALNGVKGAVVVMDPRTGAILALASSPGFNNADIQTILDAGDNSNDSLFNRATSALYAPGSTFKALVLAAALDTGAAQLDSKFDGSSPLEIGGAKVSNYADRSFGMVNLQYATAQSINTVYGQLAVKLGPDKLVEYAHKFGYGQQIGNSGVSAKASLMPLPKEMTVWETAWAGCGQPVGAHASPAGPQTTILQNCLVISAIANGGIVMDPHIVERVLSPEGEIISTTTPRTMGKAVSSVATEKTKIALKSVVDEGTGKAARVKGVEVAGKTGTAQTSKKIPDSLFIGFAPYDKPSVAISVIVEEAKDRTGAQVASQVLRSALIAQGVIRS